MQNLTRVGSSIVRKKSLLTVTSADSSKATLSPLKDAITSASRTSQGVDITNSTANSRSTSQRSQGTLPPLDNIRISEKDVEKARQAGDKGAVVMAKYQYSNNFMSTSGRTSRGKNEPGDTCSSTGEDPLKGYDDTKQGPLWK